WAAGGFVGNRGLRDAICAAARLDHRVAAEKSDKKFVESSVPWRELIEQESRQPLRIVADHAVLFEQVSQEHAHTHLAHLLQLDAPLQSSFATTRARDRR